MILSFTLLSDFFDAFDVLPGKTEDETYFESLKEFSVPPKTLFSVFLDFLTYFIFIPGLYVQIYYSRMALALETI